MGILIPICQSPSQTSYAYNDDLENNEQNSRIDVDIEASGTYEIVVTSYYPNETGRYMFNVQRSELSIRMQE